MTWSGVLKRSIETAAALCSYGIGRKALGPTRRARQMEPSRRIGLLIVLLGAACLGRLPGVSAVRREEGGGRKVGVVQVYFGY